MVSLIIFVLGVMFITNMDFDIEKINIEKILMFCFKYIMSIEFFAFICQIFLVINA